jgi:hypothetical protein
VRVRRSINLPHAADPEQGDDLIRANTCAGL